MDSPDPPDAETGTGDSAGAISPLPSPKLRRSVVSGWCAPERGTEMVGLETGDSLGTSGANERVIKPESELPVLSEAAVGKVKAATRAAGWKEGVLSKRAVVGCRSADAGADPTAGVARQESTSSNASV